jgi:hypothetical protein
MRTRGQTLLELLGLVGVLKDEGVDVGGASDLELDVVDLLVLLYAGGCNAVSLDFSSHSTASIVAAFCVSLLSCTIPSPTATATSS